MIKKLYAHIFNKGLVYVSYGFGHDLKIVSKDADGNEYVNLRGEIVVLSKTNRRVIWMRREK